MITRKLVPALLALLSTSTCVWAAATAEQATQIEKALQAYLGSEPGVVAVAPAGEAYDITLDATPYLKKSTVQGFTAKIDPTHIMATPNGDGTWAVSSSGPFNFSTSIPDSLDFDMHIAAHDWQGTFSEAMSAFSKSTYTMSGITVSQKVTDPQSKVKTAVSYGVEKIDGTSDGTDVGNGLVSLNSTMNFSGITSATNMEVPPEAAATMPAMNYTATLAKGSTSSKIDSAQVKPLISLLAWFVEHPSKELMIKDQAGLKEKLLAAIPAFASLESTGTFDGVNINTSLGQFQLTSGGSSLGMSGVAKQGHFAEGFSITGFKIPAGLAPAWAEGLVPSTIKLGFDVTGFDLEAPARMFVGQMDLNTPDVLPPGSEALYLPAFAPTNSVKITLPASEISGADYALNYEGTVDASFAGLPTVDAKFTMKGMDAVIAKLQQAAADPNAQQGMAALFAVKGLGKAQPDGSLLWEVKMGSDGKMLVNGTDVSAMMGAAPPPQQ